jgi:hypothetical protein
MNSPKNVLSGFLNQNAEKNNALSGFNMLSFINTFKNKPDTICPI